MKKIFTKISYLIMAVIVLFCAVGCDLEQENNNSACSSVSNSVSVTLKKLATPEVVIGLDGVAKWGEVDYAYYYAYVIDNGEERTTDETRVQLKENQSIKVKAVSISEQYTDSDYSDAKKYIKADIPQDHKHSDVDEDGVCCICGESVMAEISFYAINDLHGKFMDTNTQPGLDEFSTYMKRLYADDTRSEILLSSGDMWQGTVESSTNKGRLMTEWMNELNFSSMTLGNHEYDWGSQVLTPNSRLAEFPFLAINVTYNGQAVDYCKPSTIVEANGVKIGIIGAIGDCLSSISGDFSNGLDFATGRELTRLVKNEADRLRHEEECDFIVYSIHDGYEGSSSSVNKVSDYDISKYYDVSLSDGYIDLVFEGHTHQSYILQDTYGVYHLQGGGENNYISHAELSYNTVTNKYTIKPHLVNNRVYGDSHITDDPCVEEIFTKYFPTDNPYTTILGANDSEKDSFTICEKLAELYYSFGVEKWGNNFNIALGGGFLRLRSPYKLHSGNITYADIFSILPFDNDLVLGKIRGSDLKSRFLNSDNGDYHVYLGIQEKEILDNQYYYIVVDSYTSTYRYNHITEVDRVADTKYARDLLADFISDGGWDNHPKAAKNRYNLQLISYTRQKISL